MIQLWLNRSDSVHTRRQYQRTARQFLHWVGRPLAEVRVIDIQTWDANTLTDRAPATRATQLAIIKSLFSEARRLGYLPFDPGAVIRVPKLKDPLAERVLSEAQVQHMFAVTPCGRNRTLLLLLYYGGLRVAELCALRWRDVQALDDGNLRLTIFGKGAKTRYIIVGPQVSEALGRRGELHTPLFGSRKRSASGERRLQPAQVWRIVRQTARLAGIDKPVSPHWFRHTHATHALKNGATIVLVQRALGHRDVSTTGRYLHLLDQDSSSFYLPEP